MNKSKQAAAKLKRRLKDNMKNREKRVEELRGAIAMLTPAQVLDCANRGMLKTPQLIETYMKDVADCLAADEHMKKIDEANALLTEEENFLRNRRLVHQRHTPAYGSPAMMALELEALTVKEVKRQGRPCIEEVIAQ